MPIFSKIIVLSKRIALSLLKNEQPTALKDSEIFNESDKTHILKNLTNKSLIKERLKLANQIDEQKDWETIEDKIDIPVRKFYWYYAVAAAVISILLTGYFLETDPFNNSIESTPTIVNHTIEKGTDKATLTLGDGSIVTLEKGSSFKTNNISSNGKDIVYDKKRATSKISYNYLTIPRGGQYHITLSDGTQVWLNSESQLKYPVSFIDGETRQVELVYGEAYFDVSPSSKHEGAEFKVYNDAQEIQVLGTEFNVKAYKDEPHVYTTLVAGKVAVNFNGKKQNLTPNQQSKLNIKTNTLDIATVDVYNEISWKEGVFSFEEKSLEDIMKILSRWYDIDPIFMNHSTKKEEFNGILSKDQNIEDILNSIKNFGIIENYEIKNKKVVLE